MTEPNEPTVSDEGAMPDEVADVVETSDAITFTDPPTSAEPAESEPATEPIADDVAVDDEATDDATAEPESEPQPVESEADAGAPAEPVVLPDESNSRTSELAARLRQSALAQVEAARAALTADSPPAQSLETQPPTGPAIPALDDPRPVIRPVIRDSEPQTEPLSEPMPTPMSEPIAVAAAAVAEAEATGGQAFLSGPTEPDHSSASARIKLATIAAAALAVVAVVVLVIFARSSAHDHAVEKARTAALAAAKPEVALALTYDYRTLDSDFAKAETGMTTKFKANYARTAADSVTPLATSTHAISTGTVAEAGVISASTSTVRVLVFADQTAQNKQLGDKSRLDRSVIEVTMVKQGGRWVIDDLKPF